MTLATLESTRQAGSRFVMNQALSSAQMVERMVVDEMRRGEFSQLEARVARIEELVNQGFLKREDERRLRLLAAKFLEGAGETKRAYRITGLLLADKDTLSRDFFAELRRFRTRLALNVGNLNEARSEVDRIDRLVVRTDEAFGSAKEVVDEDVSSVTAATWLLAAEVALAEGNCSLVLDVLGRAFDCMSHIVKTAEETAMFELLSALGCFGNGEDASVPALAYLYRVHVVLDSGIEAMVRARIAAAAGDTQRTRGLSDIEAQRWRSYGPQASLVARYLGEGEGLVPPAQLLNRFSAARSAPVAGQTAKRIEEPRQLAIGAGPPGRRALPMFFFFEAFGLEEITTMFDYNLKTGPLVIDWSQCDAKLIKEAIQGGAISERALACSRGTIYFNNGAYVDAGFEGSALGEGAAPVVEAIFELFRISMAGLPGACGYQPAAGALAARVPEVINLRPNKINIDLMRKLDHARSGGAEIDFDGADLDSALDLWLPDQVREESVPESTVSVVGVSDLEAGDDRNFIGKLAGMINATEVSSVWQTARECLEALGIRDPVVDIRVLGSEGALVDANGSAEGRVSVERCRSGVVTASLLLPEGEGLNCSDAISVVLNVAAQRLRTMPGLSLLRPIEAPDFIAADPVSQALLSQLRDFAVLDGTDEKRKLKAVLLQGERGSGKEILARAIHNWSGRADKPFRAVNFGAISKELAASEIFGSKRGAFTGSVADRRGYIQEAEGGTLFLDELDEANETVQAMLKRLVQFGVFNVVGDPGELKANVRFVAATNVVAIDNRAIKHDLKDRFLLVRVPPLRERRGDIRPLAEFFASECGFGLPGAVLAFLEKLDWPGNVRQLQNVLERSCAIASSADDLTLDLVQRSAVEDGATLVVADGNGSGFMPLRSGETLDARIEKERVAHIRYALEFCNGNRTHAATYLGMTRQWLLKQIDKFNISV